MDPIANPYAPGAGTPPPLLAGRDGVLDAFDVVIGRAAAGNSFQPIVLSGLRGVGKTVLLLAFRSTARDAGWPIELFEARPGGDLRSQVAEALPPMIRTVNKRWRNRARAQRIGRIAASFARAVQATLLRSGFRLELEPEPGVADSGDLETDLTELLVALGEGAQDEGVGAALLIDELHEVPPEQLSALVGAAHRVNQDGLPVVLGGAGLPPVGRVLSEARSYAERLFSIRPVGALSPDDSARAFLEPAEALGVDITDGALDRLVRVSGGYPFFIQSYGKHVWDLADDSPIAEDDVDLAEPRAYRELVDSFFKPRYDRATPSERRYLHAMAELGDGDVSSAVVATRLGHDQPSRVSPQRDGLLTKGLIYAPERGVLAFTVPHMAAYLRQLPERP
ncbi:MAG: ATP-binding protein [Acidimicrobiia bacterium]|nr:ATP-binding protein [Acidimicrobiia bacterium]